jgi:hypothetical protein
VFVINIVLYSSSAGYYWLETVDHYALSINLVVFLFIQLIVMVYMLPISQLVDKIQKFGEDFPKMYLFLLKYVCPVLALLLTCVSILGEINSPLPTKSIYGKLVGYLVLITPIIVLIVVAVWNPFGGNDNNKAGDSSSHF